MAIGKCAVLIVTMYTEVLVTGKKLILAFWAFSKNLRLFDEQSLSEHRE